jgi:hypothetical protein
MHVGHFAAGFLGKRVAPQLSLGTMILAAMLADFLWCIFMLAGLEKVQFKTALGAANYFQPIDITLSHSLVMIVVWAAIFAGIHFLWRRNKRPALLLFCLVLSHWPMDVIAHKPDMPWAPGVSQYLGLGLWTNIPATMIVEGGLWVIAILVFLRTIRWRKRLALLVFWPVILLITLIFYNNVAGPPPPNPQTAPVVSLVYFSLVVAWAYWVNRLCVSLV